MERETAHLPAGAAYVVSDQRRMFWICKCWPAPKRVRASSSCRRTNRCRTRREGISLDSAAIVTVQILRIGWKPRFTACGGRFLSRSRRTRPGCATGRCCGRATGSVGQWMGRHIAWARSPAPQLQLHNPLSTRDFGVQNDPDLVIDGCVLLVIRLPSPVRNRRHSGDGSTRHSMRGRNDV